MSKKTRKIFFLFLVFFFLITAPSIVFYSWGYRFDFETKKIVKTGAFYFKVIPKGVKINIAPIEKEKINREKKISKKTNYFFGAVFIDNLLPKKYQVEIQKEDFHPWGKTLEIKENQVTEVKNVILFPQKFNFDLAFKNIEDFFPSPDEKIILLKEKIKNQNSDPSILSENNNEWEIKIFETESSVVSKLINSKDISKEEVKIVNLKFSFDSKKVLLKTEIKEKTKYFLINLNDFPKKINNLDFLKEETKDVFFHPANNQKLLFFEKESLWEVDLDQSKISPKEILKEIIPLETINKKFYYFDNNGFLFKDDFSQKEKINKVPFSLNSSQKLKINIFSGFIFLINDQKLYFLNPDSGSFEFIFETNKEPKISSDYKKVLYFSDYEIWVMFLTPENNQPQKLFIARFSEKIENAFFFNDFYLIFNVGDKIKIAEIDNRDVVNIIDLAEFPSSKIFWKRDSKNLFILSKENFNIAKKIFIF